MRRSRLLSLVLLMACLAVGPARAARDLAGELRAAQAALAAGDHARAYALYLEHGQDNALAQFSLGLFHAYGWGRPVDRAEACRWQEKAAQGGIPAAQQLLGDCLRQGVHRPVDAAGAAHWYEKAARSGIVAALCSLGEMTMRGEGVAQDPRKAIQLCAEAAQKGSVSAQASLARLYLEGAPEVRDAGAALRWYQAAAESGLPEAQFALGQMLRDGIGHERDLNAARGWLEAAASQGYLPAYLETAKLYFAAPPEPETQRLAAADLAKAYLWASAATQRLAGTEQAQASQLLSDVLRLMPESWRGDLDQRVAAHLHKVAPPAPIRSPAP